jgi:choline dehydrogenase
VPREDRGADGLSRRAFNALGLAGVSSLVAGCVGFGARGNPFPPLACAERGGTGEDYEYIVVGSGAGGGPLAANLAREGYRVLLLEAGGDDEPYTYQVPAFHAFAAEDPVLRWDYFVRHYADESRQRRDWKYAKVPAAFRRGGVLYPRAGTLGGCTAHNAMITIYGHNSDWDAIAELMGDASWKSANMRRYFQRVERCQYLARPQDPDDIRDNPGRRGFDGWLATEAPDVTLAARDAQLAKIIVTTAWDFVAERPSFARAMGAVGDAVLHLDPNDWRLVQRSAEGVFVTPLATHGRQRNGTREYLRRTQAQCPRNLTIKTHALVSRVLLEGARAVGVEYLDGPHLYAADPQRQPGATAPRRTLRASREVILAAGAFNTPQLLMLSGIGPGEELARHGIEVRVPLAGVGRNLQDRYEVGVVLEMKRPFSLLEGVEFKPRRPGEAPDEAFREWQQQRGVYTTNGVVVAVVTRSSDRQPEPDLFVFGVAGHFEGYYPGYSEKITGERTHFTWAILKGHTRNTGGSVRLCSADPTDVPAIDFAYFEEGNDAAGEDLEAVVTGVEQARRMTKRMRHLVRREITPGDGVRTREQIREWVRDHAWGHHACGTCRIGPPSDPLAVIDSRFRVHGVQALRVVDASVFPRIPGFFIVTPIYMISEKASEVILADARHA